MYYNIIILEICLKYFPTGGYIAPGDEAAAAGS